MQKSKIYKEQVIIKVEVVASQKPYSEIDKMEKYTFAVRKEKSGNIYVIPCHVFGIPTFSSKVLAEKDAKCHVNRTEESSDNNLEYIIIDVTNLLEEKVIRTFGLE